MKFNRTLQSFCLSLLVLAPTMAAQVAPSCGTICKIQEKIENIQTELSWIVEQLTLNLSETAYSSEEKSPVAPEGLGQSPSNTPSVPDSAPIQAVVSPISSTQPLSSFQTSIIPSSISSGSAIPSAAPLGSSSSSSTKVSAPSSGPVKPSSASSASLVPSSQTNTTFNIPNPTGSASNSTMGGGQGFKSIAYFVNWGIYARKYTPDKIPVDKLTHILYAFADNRDDGTVVLTDSWSDVDIHYPPGDSWNDVGKNMYGNLKQLNIFKKKNRNLKIMLSIGGWTYTHEAKHFDGPASTPQGRKAFADSCVNMIKDYGFDGIDLDWEYPQNPEQGKQLLELVKEIRKAMDAYAQKLASGYQQAPHFQISIAAPAGKQNYQNLPLGELGAALDFINLMGYDFAGSWDRSAGHQANLFKSNSCPACTPFDVNDVINDYKAAGVPAEKIVLGMPLYGRAFENTDGIGKPFNGVGGPSHDHRSWEGGVWDYAVLPLQGATEHFDEEAGASYSYDANRKKLVTYDNVKMATKKAQYIKECHLGGAMWWELSGDRPINDEGSIIANVVRELGGSDGKRLEQTPNWLVYPDSQYDNLKAGFPNDK